MLCLCGDSLGADKSLVYRCEVFPELRLLPSAAYSLAETRKAPGSVSRVLLSAPRFLEESLLPPEAPDAIPGGQFSLRSSASVRKNLAGH